METGKLSVQLRDKTGKGNSRKLRGSNLVPGVCYGEGVDEALLFSVDPKALRLSLDPVKKNNTLLELTFEKDGAAQKTVPAMVWDFQVHPTRQNVTHVDLKAIDTSKPMNAKVPVELVGRAKGSIDGGIVSWERREATIKAKPTDIPSTLQLDISPMEIGGALHLSDITLPDNVTFISSTKLTVCTCVAPRADKVAAATTDAEAGAEGAAEGDAAAKPADAKEEGKK